MNITLIGAALLSAIAALIHIGCIIYGASWYRFFGAGEQMAIWAEQGSNKPSVITSFIVLVLTVWSLYAFSAAGVIAKLPFMKLALIGITSIYLLRGLAGFFLIGNSMGRSPEFWLWSSLICSIIGVLHLLGLKQIWSTI